MMEESSKVWFITGTTSGFGRRLVYSALARGDRVIATGRSAEKLAGLIESCDGPLRENIRTLQLDILEGRKSIEEKMAQAARFWGRIDVLVNNAGGGYLGLLEEGGTELLRTQFELNVFGLMDVTLAGLPYLRAHQGSTLIIIGSRSAWRTEIAGIGLYSASKAAVHALAETLAVELAQFGVRVLHVAPGAFRTEGIYDNGFYHKNKLDDYTDIHNAAVRGYTAHAGTQIGDPAKAMEVVVDTVKGEGVAKGKPWPGLLVLGEDADHDLRRKCEGTLQTLDEWKDVSTNLNLDGDQ